VKSPPRFIADAMLGSLARKLRIFGFDTLYFGEGGDPELEALAKEEKRVILTSDKRLFARSKGKRGLRAVLVDGTTDRARLRSVMGESRPTMTLRLGRGRASRCAVCNGELEVFGRRDARSTGIPAKVLARHRLFYACKSCSRFYWRGKHWERLRRLSYSLKTKDLT
jgi:uncharacterized protein with PIN domain